ncbi:3'(2'),5'-bisphosphate nucleotidase CysQ [Candidatus Pelagibacter sp.]|nr:3'(2'),5'-bisphosphate nucleotidase CysQ [Candidatus Pelagibacter sp.]
MKQIEIKAAIEKLIETFLYAGKVSIELREKGLIKEIKEDNTPVSNGDLEVNRILTEKISDLTPQIPIVSEETSHNKSNKDLKDFWLIDPIDGTYDYINDLDEFTLNAGLIINNRAVAGIIYAPAKNRLFYSYEKGCSFEIINNKHVKLDTSKISNNKLKFVSYSNKLKPEINKIYQTMNVSEFKRMKSSLKFCVIASNEYDGYVAEPRACEWDIAAGHAILENAGGIVTDFEGNEILYGKENFKNPSIILKRNKNI